MNSRIRELKARLRRKEAELLALQAKVARKQTEYSMVRNDPRLGWYGKTQYQRAIRECKYIQREIDEIKRELYRRKETEVKNNVS